MRLARRPHGVAGRFPFARCGSTSKSASVIPGWSYGSLRKYQAHTMSHARLVVPRMTKATLHDAYASNSAIIGGVTAFPIRADECVIPCANPQLRVGGHLAMARGAVGNAAPSPNP